MDEPEAYSAETALAITLVTLGAKVDAAFQTASDGIGLVSIPNAGWILGRDAHRWPGSFRLRQPVCKQGV